MPSGLYSEKQSLTECKIIIQTFYYRQTLLILATNQSANKNIRSLISVAAHPKQSSQYIDYYQHKQIKLTIVICCLISCQVDNTSPFQIRVFPAQSLTIGHIHALLTVEWKKHDIVNLTVFTMVNIRRQQHQIPPPKSKGIRHLLRIKNPIVWCAIRKCISYVVLKT